jgi:hypothetical protein
MPFGSEDTAIFFRDGSVAVLADGSTARVHLDYPEPIEDFAGTSLPGQIVGKPVMTFPTGLLVNRDDAINVGGTDYKVRTVRKIADGLLSVAELKLAAILLFALLLPAFARAQRMPDRDLTPGVVAITDTRKVCSIRWGKDERHVTPAMKRAVYAAYGVNPKAGICTALATAKQSSTARSTTWSRARTAAPTIPPTSGRSPTIPARARTKKTSSKTGCTAKSAPAA